MAITGICSSAIRTLRGDPENGSQLTTGAWTCWTTIISSTSLYADGVSARSRTSVRIDSATVTEQMFDVNARPSFVRVVTAWVSRVVSRVRISPNSASFRRTHGVALEWFGDAAIEESRARD